MEETLILGLVAVIALGTLAQWAAWRLRIPSILVLIVVGFLVGPIAGLLDPDALLGELTLPLVSLAAAVVLFEGGLTASLAEIRSVAGPVRRLVTLGLLVTWLAISGAAYLFLGLSPGMSLLLGAILVVTGPTVIGPLLRHVRPKGKIGSILKLEGIINDPFGAVLAILVFQGLRADRIEHAVGVVTLGVVKSIFAGLLPGLAGAGLLYLLLRRNQLPDFLRNTASLALALAVYVAANLMQSESGLLAVTVMGIAMASQKRVRMDSIEEFSGHLRTVLISALFIVLAARIDLDEFEGLPFGIVAFLAAVLLARPLMVLVSTIRSGISWRDKAMLSSVAPRGIVAAAVSSVFGMRLLAAGHEDAEMLMPVTFLVIVTTVALYGLGAAPMATLLGLREKDPQGVLFVGAGPLSRAVARAVDKCGFRTILIDSDWSSVTQARSEGLRVAHGSAMSEELLNRIDLEGVGKLFAMTRSDGVNTLAAVHFRKLFGEDDVYQVRPSGDTSRDKGAYASHLHGGHVAWGKRYNELMEWVYRGAVVKTTQLTESFGWLDYLAHYGDTAIPLMAVSAPGDKLRVLGEEAKTPMSGETVISLVMPSRDRQTMTSQSGERPIGPLRESQTGVA